jgi:hypothetical protein
MRTIAALALLFTAMCAAAANSFVTTKGEAKIEVPPDFALLSIHLMAVGPDLEALKRDVDAPKRFLRLPRRTILRAPTFSRAAFMWSGSTKPTATITTS